MKHGGSGKKPDMSDNEADSGGVATQNPPATRTPSVKPPRPLDVSETTAKSWKLWKQLWENYSIVARLDLQDESYQKAIFLCTIGEDALEIFNVFEFSDSDDPNKVSTIIQKLTSILLEISMRHMNGTNSTNVGNWRGRTSTLI